MTQQEKELLLIDLCARLPYGVVVSKKPINESFTWKELRDFQDGKIYKPYLRPMSSMTNEERKEYNKECNKVLLLRYSAKNHYPVTDWLLAHHFDFRGLIEKGLALEAPEDMYQSVEYMVHGC